MAGVPSTKPYLIRAIQEWCLDQGFTPYLAVTVTSRTKVPRDYVKDGQIVLNLGPEATHQLMMGNDFITFSARFNGVAQALSIPIDNISAIYARENGQGMAFEVVAEETGTAGDKSASVEEESSVPPVTPPKSHLTRVK
ncbi:MAG: ClpXP protease specificity-enhancing factor [Betaproteobacteria bacterium]|nr:ClpXP protease specificity-enhancing factor [Betaproteobacteria bacterium]